MNGNHKPVGRNAIPSYPDDSVGRSDTPSYDEVREARITAYALGQLDGEEKAVVEAELAASPAARLEVADIRTLAGQVREANRAMVVPPSETLRAAVELRLSQPAVLTVAPRPDVLSAPPLPALHAPRRWRAWAAVAAAVCLMAAAAGIYVARGTRATEQTVDQVAITSPTAPEQLPEAKQPQTPEVPKTSEVSGGPSHPIEKTPEKTDQKIPTETGMLAAGSPPPVEKMDSDGWRPHVASPVEDAANHSQPTAAESSRLALDDATPPVPKKRDSKKIDSRGSRPAFEKPIDVLRVLARTQPRGMRHLAAAKPEFPGQDMGRGSVYLSKGPEIVAPPPIAPKRIRDPGSPVGPGKFGAGIRAAGTDDTASDAKEADPARSQDTAGKSRPSETHFVFPPGMRSGGETPSAVSKTAKDFSKSGKKAKTAVPAPAENDSQEELTADVVAENEFLPAAKFPYSAFSLEADRRTYALVDRYLRAGLLPRADQVEIEGLLNYFAYDDPQPNGDLPFAVHVEGADCPWARDHRLVRIAIVGRDWPATAVGRGRTEQGSAPRPVARHARVQVQFMPALVASYRLIGYDGPPVAGKKAEGSLATGLSFPAGQTVTALYEVVPAPPANAKPPVVEVRPTKSQRTPARDITAVDPSTVLLTVRLHYQRPGAEAYWLLEAPWTDPGQSFDAASRDFRFAAAVAAFGMTLRASQYRGDISLEAIERIADSARGEDRQRAELVNLVRLARKLGAGR